MAPASTSQAELTRKRISRTRGGEGDGRGQGIDDGVAAKEPGHGGHQPHGGDVDAIQHGRRPGIAAKARHQRVEQGDEDERGQEDADRGQDRARHTGDEIPDERRGREDRARGHLADRHRIEQLLIGQPAEALDEVVAQKGQQDVAAAVEHRSDLEKGQEERHQTHRRPAPPEAAVPEAS